MGSLIDHPGGTHPKPHTTHGENLMDDKRTIKTESPGASVQSEIPLVTTISEAEVRTDEATLKRKRSSLRTPTVHINVRKDNDTADFHVPIDTLPDFTAMLTKIGKCKKTMGATVYNIPDTLPAAFEMMLHWIDHKELLEPTDEKTTSDRVKAQSALIELYFLATSFGLRSLQNAVVDDLQRQHDMRNILSCSLLKRVYQRTATGCKLRKWFIDKAARLKTSSIYRMYQDEWPAEAFVDLAVTLKDGSAPPSTNIDMSGYHD